MDPVTLILLTVLIGLPLFILLKGSERDRKIAKAISKLPGERKYPIIGSQWSVLKAGKRNFYYVQREKNKKYGPLYRNWLGSIPFVITFKPEHIQAIVNSRLNVNKSEGYKFLKTIVHDGVFTSEAEKWRRDRKLVTPSLHLQMLDNFVPIFNERGRMLSSRLLDLSRNGTFFDVFPLMQRFAFDAICETSTGFKTQSLEGRNVHYVDALAQLFEAAIARMVNPFLHNELIFKLSSTGKKFYKLQSEVDEFIQSIIDWRKKSQANIANNNFDGLQEHNVGEKRKQILLDALLEAGGSTEDRDDFWIKSQVLTAVFAGLDTSSASLAWALYALATNPEIQETVYEELKETFHDDMERDVTMRDINSMTYLDRTMKEVLRLYTVAPSFSRKLEEDVVLEEFTMPAGCMVAVQLFELHRDPTIYPDPEKFDPDRFLPENVSKRHPYSYVPFSAGHRNCLGQKFAHKSLRIALVHVLRKYRVVAQHKPEEIRYTVDMTFKPESGIFLKFEKRK